MAWWVWVAVGGFVWLMICDIVRFITKELGLQNSAQADRTFWRRLAWPFVAGFWYLFWPLTVIQRWIHASIQKNKSDAEAERLRWEYEETRRKKEEERARETDQLKEHVVALKQQVAELQKRNAALQRRLKNTRKRTKKTPSSLPPNEAKIGGDNT